MKVGHGAAGWRMRRGRGEAAVAEAAKEDASGAAGGSCNGSEEPAGGEAVQEEVQAMEGAGERARSLGHEGRRAVAVCQPT